MNVFNFDEVRKCIAETADSKIKETALAFLDNNVKSDKSLNVFVDAYDADGVLKLAEKQLTSNAFYSMCLISWAINKRTYGLDIGQGFIVATDEPCMLSISSVPEHPVDEQYLDHEIDMVAEYIYGLCDMTTEAELPSAEALESLKAALKKTYEHSKKQLFDYLVYAALGYDTSKKVWPIHDFQKDPESEGWVTGKTKSGTPLSLIAKFILSQQDMGVIMDYDDEMHFWLLNDGLKNADPVLLYYLSNMVEHNVKHVSAKDEN